MPYFVDPLINTILNKLSKCEDDAIIETWRRSVNTIIAPALQSGRVPVLSRENLAILNHTKLAMNIERVFGPSKVILVVRHPLSWIESVYFHTLPSTKSIYFTFENWITPHWNNWDKKKKRSSEESHEQENSGTLCGTIWQAKCRGVLV